MDEKPVIDHRPRERRITASIVVAMAISYGLVFAFFAWGGWAALIAVGVLVFAINIWYRVVYGEWMDYI
jgi:1,4-dihydroxy-2-naphthoate octaprenyltransferase